MLKQAFERFLKSFIEKVESKTLQVHQAFWLLETTGSPDSAKLQAQLSAELKTFFSHRPTYEKLLYWQTDSDLKDPWLKRQLQVLIQSFKPNLISKKWLLEISQKESKLAYLFATFRPHLDKKPLSDNDVRLILKSEKNIQKRQRVWQASKEIGPQVADELLSLVRLRNQAAQSIGYSDYFQMQLDLQEIDESWLFNTLDTLCEQTKDAYQLVLDTIHQELKRRFNVNDPSMCPWAWAEPFGQEDPLNFSNFDEIVQGCDLLAFSKDFFKKMGFDVTEILAHSDMFERAGKNQRAFCIHMDRRGDIRTLNNVQPTLKWLETVLHELGHAVYELGLDEALPWLLRTPAHMLTTEAMALFSGRWAYRAPILKKMNPRVTNSTLKEVEESLRRRQLIFSRWVLVMTYFERELYKDPDQDLQGLWWKLVQRYQGIEPPRDRLKGPYADWACKSHLSVAPVYYFSYLLGEMLASEIEQAWGNRDPLSREQGDFLREKLFSPGNSLRWDLLVKKLTGHPLSAKSWIDQFAK